MARLRLFTALRRTPNIQILADPRLLGALRRTVSSGRGEGGFEWLWMKRICLCFFPSRNELTERARETAARYTFNSFFLSRARDFTTFTLHDLTDFYIERATHRITINYHSCFKAAGTNSKTNLQLHNFWEQGGHLVFRGPYTALVFCI